MIKRIYKKEDYSREELKKELMKEYPFDDQFKTFVSDIDNKFNIMPEEAYEKFINWVLDNKRDKLYGFDIKYKDTIQIDKNLIFDWVDYLKG